jgi:hypothetical protein
MQKWKNLDYVTIFGPTFNLISDCIDFFNAKTPQGAEVLFSSEPGFNQKLSNMQTHVF